MGNSTNRRYNFGFFKTLTIISFMRRSNSSARWLNEHFNDPYVKRAQQAGYRSRAAFKLLEIQEKDKLLHPGISLI